MYEDSSGLSAVLLKILFFSLSLSLSSSSLPLTYTSQTSPRPPISALKSLLKITMVSKDPDHSSQVEMETGSVSSTQTKAEIKTEVSRQHDFMSRVVLTSSRSVNRRFQQYGQSSARFGKILQRIQVLLVFL